MSRQSSVKAQTSDGVTAIERGGEAFRVRERKGSNSTVSLLVSGADDGLSVTVGSSGDLENYSELRRLVEETAADFDLKISSFQLNGFNPQSFTSALGGKSGSRTR
jgi:hypothetical protein